MAACIDVIKIKAAIRQRQHAAGLLRPISIPVNRAGIDHQLAINGNTHGVMGVSQNDHISLNSLRDHLQQRERILTALLELMASEKWFERRGDDYHLLPEGHRVKTYLADRMASVLEPLQSVIQQTDVQRLEALLAQIINYALDSKTPPGCWCLEHSRRRAPADSSPSIHKIFQYCADLNAFRDDAHMAAWRPYGVSGAAWEAFNYVCSGQAANADELFDQLAYRGYSREEYAQALQTLASHGWVAAANENVKVTDEGRAISAQVERVTDRYFYAPWLQLSETELDDLNRLFEQLDLELKALEKAQQESS